MRGFGMLGAVAALVLALAGNGVCAQTATTAQVGKPMALLAGLRPPHETKHKVARHTIHAKAAHQKTGGKTRHARAAAAHARPVSAKKLATRHFAHHEHAVTASAFAEEPPPQAPSDPPPAAAPNWPVANAVSANDAPLRAAASAAAPAPTNASATAAGGAFPDPDPSKVQTIKITAPDPVSRPEPIADHGTAATANDGAAAAPAAFPAQAVSQSATAAPAPKPMNKEPIGKAMAGVGSTSWIAQVLAALGGAVAAGAVAWFLIGTRPVRTYG